MFRKPDLEKFADTYFYQSHYLEKDGKISRVTELFFRSLVTGYTLDNKELVKKLSDGELDQDDLQKIIAEYNLAKIKG